MAREAAVGVVVAAGVAAVAAGRAATLVSAAHLAELVAGEVELLEVAYEAARTEGQVVI